MLRLLSLRDDRRKPRLQRAGRIGTGELRERGHARVDAVEERRLVLVLLSRNGGVDQLIPCRAETTTATAESRERRHAARPLTFVITARVGADIGVSPAQQRIVNGGV